MSIDENFFLNLVRLENNFFQNMSMSAVDELSKNYSVMC